LFLLSQVPRPANIAQRLQINVHPKPKPKSWIRGDASPIFSPSADMIDGFEKERLEIIRMQEQRARMHEEQFKLRPATENKARSGSVTDVHQFNRISAHVETSPTYENCSGLSKYANHFVASRESMKSDRYSGPLLREGELRWSKKSVTFDEQPATVSVYTPPGTPHESLSEGALANRDHEENKGGGIENRPLNMRPQRNLLDIRATDERFPRSAAHEKTHSKMSTLELTSQTQVMDINQVENAENLPFKEKMKLFAQAIGEEEPKSRLKASSRELNLLKTIVR
uniref:AKAP2_C domain-containing protein n=1 Tax=Schistocephalus solidus TaxID=70667 RepID=A0A183TIU7_SCHSO